MLILGIKCVFYKSVINLHGTNEYFTSVENTKLLLSDALCETLYELDFKGLDVDNIPFTADIIDLNYTFQRLTEENYPSLQLDIRFFDTLNKAGFSLNQIQEVQFQYNYKGKAYAYRMALIIQIENGFDLMISKAHDLRYNKVVLHQRGEFNWMEVFTVLIYDTNEFIQPVMVPVELFG
ncbi:MAG: hypothetical protein IPH94_19395 [Saprospiraceae bacterium]|nr:hypothetical protein [Saprospiraceae bacterium]